MRRHPLAGKYPGNCENAVEYFNYLAKSVIEISDLPPTMTRFVEAGLDVVGKPAEKESFAEKPFTARSAAENTHKDSFEVNDNTDARGINAAADKKQFVLNQLALAWRAGETAGREKILEAAKKDHIPMTQKQVRELLDELAKEGLIQVGRGRGGSRITEKGLQKLINK